MTTDGNNGQTINLIELREQFARAPRDLKVTDEALLALMFVAEGLVQRIEQLRMQVEINGLRLSKVEDCQMGDPIEEVKS